MKTQYLSSDNELSKFLDDSRSIANHYVSTERQQRQANTFNTARYLASHADLIDWLGYNLEGAKQHYNNAGKKEGRRIDSFDAAQYLASHGDLINWLGYNLEAATEHYIDAGYREKRATDRFDAEQYLASNAESHRQVWLQLRSSN